MYSQCPDCLARFRITAAQLRAAHGTVRCGRCGGAFDALNRLSDSVPKTEPVDDTGLLAEDADELAAAAQSGVPAEYHFSAADLEKVFIEARDWSPPATAAPVFDSDSEPQELIVEEPEQIEDITLEGERIALEGVDFEDAEDEDADDEDTDDEDAFPPEALEVGADTPLDFDLTGDVEILAVDATPPMQGLAEPSAAARNDATAGAPAVATPTAATPAGASMQRPAARDWPLPPPSRPRPQPASPAPISAGERWSLPNPAEEPTDADEEESERRRALTWRVGCAVLALLLVVQVAHHYRERLVRQPSVGPAVRALYAAIGVSIGDAWDLNAFELRQWGAGSELSAGRLNVRASVTNRADFAQPLPLLRVEIEDRFGAAVAIRDFQPREYLKNPARVGRLLATGESADAELDVVAAGVEGVGYRLNVCMRDADGSVHCASAPG
jgi:predicted Zn finger-like uncharacterized protein